ncbi:MAG: ABC transporter ATP-binding protein, partial [Anderseniella sp.]|nr:ABC transporter ATP-binding protein [Anderseniella sp.]
MKPIVSIRNVTKRYPGVVAVDDVSFDIQPNEFFALLGPSGCGKTTLLRMIAGLETKGEGEILIDGQPMDGVPANQRPVNMVFQSYAVFPHMTVRDNVAYGLKVTGTPAGEIAPRVEEALEMVQMGPMADRKPDQLSGGQRQRVALARALVKRPKVLLLDEPLSALDAKLREHMQLELARLQQAIGITFIIVTHDQDEALSMADRIAVMHEGSVRQIATPEGLYENPNSRFVADFIGKVNLFDGKVTGGGGKSVNIEVAGLGKISLPFDGPASGNLSLAVRPEKIRLSKTKPSG